MHWTRFALALAAPLALLGCIVTPGKFTSTLTLNADRSFAFTYIGEVIAIDPGESFAQGMAEGLSEGMSEEESAEPEADGAVFQQIQDESTPDTEAAKKAETEAKNRAIAEALRKEVGYRKVEYLGEGKFMIDYAIQSRLTHNYVYPFNTDAQLVFPFIALELRQGGTARVTAPAFANNSQSGTPGSSEMASQLDGTFTLTTDAEIVSQNSEEGAKAEGGKKVISWRATPLTKAAPMAVLRLTP